MVLSHENLRRAAAAAIALLLVAGIALTTVAQDPWPTNDGIALVVLTAYGGVGYVIARAERRNPIGWIFLGLGFLTLADYVNRLYLVLDYREHGGRLPLGGAAVFWQGSWSLFPIIVALPAIVLFPDGRLTPRWRKLLYVYAGAAIVFMSLDFAGQAVSGVTGRVAVDIRGELPNDNGGPLAAAGWVLGPFFLGCWIAFVWHQVSAWRSSAGVRRAQLKWLAAGSAILVVSCLLIVMLGDDSTTGSRIAADLATLGIGVMPVAVGVAILRFRLYEIDRLISRTLSYALLTGLLVGVFAGIVLLTARVLPFSSPVAVALSTLAAVVLFDPLRKRVQGLVDRRFNRARYDSEALVARFGARLRDAVDPETVVDELAGVAASSVEPAHISVWVRTTWLPLDELPDLGLARAALPDLREDRDRRLEALHRLVAAPGGVEEVGGVVGQRSLAVAVADGAAEGERLLRQLERPV